MNNTPPIDNTQTQPARVYNYDRLTARPKDFIPKKLDALVAHLSGTTSFNVDRMAVLAMAVDAMVKKHGVQP